MFGQHRSTGSNESTYAAQHLALKLFAPVVFINLCCIYMYELLKQPVDQLQTGKQTTITFVCMRWVLVNQSNFAVSLSIDTFNVEVPPEDFWDRYFYVDFVSRVCSKANQLNNLDRQKAKVWSVVLSICTSELFQQQQHRLVWVGGD